MDKTHSCVKASHPQLSLPSPSPTPPRGYSQALWEIPELPSPLLPFLQYGQHLPAPSFQDLSPTYNPWQDCSVPG